jgi:DNA repair exonuclease SbcCD nuclease subunit
MIRFAAIGDPHIADRHMEMSIEAMNGTLKVLEEKKDEYTFIVVMGDVFDRHGTLKLEHMKIVYDWLKKMSCIKQTFVLIGNHDRVHNRDFMSDIHPYMSLHARESVSESKETGCKGLYIIHRTSLVTFKDSVHRILFVPYVPPGRFVEAITWYLDEKKKINPNYPVRSINDIDLIFAHQEFYGSPCGPITSIKGDKWNPTYPMVISGHIHTRLRLQDNIYYTGSLYPITISESNDKGVIVGTYTPKTRMLDVVVKKVVESTKVVIRLDATDVDGITEMVSLGRKNTKYIVKGTPDQIALVKERCGDKDINVLYDRRPLEVGDTNETFDDILGSLIRDEEMKRMLSEIYE